LSSDQSLLTSTTFDILAPIIFALPTDEAVLELSLEEVVATMYPSWFAECAILLWFLHDLDDNNYTGVRDPVILANIKREWLGPLRKRARVWSRQAEDEEREARVNFVMRRLVDALERAAQAIGRGGTGEEA
jgi:hypothetical protein